MYKPEILNRMSNLTPEDKKKYPLGLALSGGGARGFAHIGAIKALDEKGIIPDIIAGTSAGAVVGAFYAAGISPEEMMELFIRHEVKDFLSFTLPNKSLLNYKGFADFLGKSIPYRNIEDLQKTLYIVASDFDTGQCSVFTKGELIPRIMASCTIPVLFEPIKIDGVRYVDGGLFRNFPVTPIRDVCDKIIGINVNPYLTDEHKENILYIAAKSWQYVFNANTAIDRQSCDFLLEIDSVSKYNTFELKKAPEIYNIGYRKMKELLDTICF